MTIKKGLIPILIVIFSALVVLQAAPASANLASPNKSIQKGAVTDQIVDVTSNPTTQKGAVTDQIVDVTYTSYVNPGGLIIVKGYVQWYCSTCNPPGWRPNPGMEVHLDQVINGQWIIKDTETTDSSGFFVLQCYAASTPGTYEHRVVMPAQGSDAGTYTDPFWTTVGY